MKKTVSLIQTRLPHYRVQVFDFLRTILKEKDIELKLIHSAVSGSEKLRKDEGNLAWATIVPIKTYRIGSIELIWQSALKQLCDSSLVIIPQENRLLLNYLLFMRKPFVRQKLALWGHGKNMTSDNCFRDRWKSFFGSLPDWWFGYTELTRETLTKAGYPESQITIFQNSIDTKELRHHAAQVKDGDIENLRKTLSMTGKHVGVFCGSIYAGKRLDFIIEAAIKIREKVHDFELVIIGTGPDESVAVSASTKYNWVYFVGQKNGFEKVLYLKLGDVFLLPYIVGLAIVDAFTLGLPLMTMDNSTHSPEVDYLKHNINGIITGNSVNAFATAAVALLQDPVRLKAMSEQCLKAANHLTAENMAMNIANGIVACLES
jgi:glycosyltransferase involved in cell wall biosynthesis